MAEYDDYSPGAWSGHNFDKARSAYTAHAGRSYAKAASSGKKASDLLPETLSTTANRPILIVCDETASMGEWPAVIFSKLPYLDHECRTEYLGEDYEACIMAFGDAKNGETYPLQARPFASGTAIKERIEELVIEKKGGGNDSESSELAALYVARNIAFPNAIAKPIVIIITDELPHPYVTKDEAMSFGRVHLQQPRMMTEEIFAELNSKCSVYVVRKPYGTSSVDAKDAYNTRVYERWSELVGADRVATLPSADRVVDVIFGLLAREAGKVDYFKKELEGRQRPDQVATVYESLKTVHALSAAGKGKKGGAKGKSVMRQLGSGKKTKPLT